MPSKKKSDYVIRKYDGDDCYSYAVFFRKDLKHNSRVVFYDDKARPIYCGLSRQEAEYYKAGLEKADAKKEIHS